MIQEIKQRLVEFRQCANTIFVFPRFAR